MSLLPNGQFATTFKRIELDSLKALEDLIAALNADRGGDAPISYLQ